MIARAGHGVRLNEHLEAEWPARVRACVLHGPGRHHVEAQGLVVSVRALAGDWPKAKNPKARPVTRLAEEDWTRAPQQIRSLLFDHLVGAAKKRQWESDAKRLSGLEIK
jgi:hypothetical protein